jgi:peptidylprolyl isomerase
MTRKALATTCALALGAGVGACGGSGASTSPGVQLAPSSGPTTQAFTAVPTVPTTPTVTTPPVVPTPASGPLSKEPKIKTPGGTPPKHLVVKDLVKGTGAVALPGHQLTVNYVGALYKNGKVFDASWKRHTTFPFTLLTTSVIPGWVRGLLGMHVGGRRELIIPPSLAYRSTAQPGIPANSTLIFIVDLLAAN